MKKFMIAAIVMAGMSAACGSPTSPMNSVTSDVLVNQGVKAPTTQGCTERGQSATPPPPYWIGPAECAPKNPKLK